MRTDLMDEDGENRAVRSFLMQYSCNDARDVDVMRTHMRRSGWDGLWPDWVRDAKPGQHLTKAGAQLWIRHLMSLEPAKRHAAEVAAPSGASVEGDARDAATMWCKVCLVDRFKQPCGRAHACEMIGIAMSPNKEG